MANEIITHSPFAQLTLIAAPAILTNACSVLAMSTSNRFLRASERLRAIAQILEQPQTSGEFAELLTRQVGRLERQAVLLLNALRGAYVALASFAVASLVSILGSGISSSLAAYWAYPFVVIAMIVGFIGAGSLVIACVYLYQATRLSVLNISEEAALIRRRESSRAGSRDQQPLSGVG